MSLTNPSEAEIRDGNAALAKGCIKCGRTPKYLGVDRNRAPWFYWAFCGPCGNPQTEKWGLQTAYCDWREVCVIDRGDQTLRSQNETQKTNSMRSNRTTR